MHNNNSKLSCAITVPNFYRWILSNDRELHLPKNPYVYDMHMHFHVCLFDISWNVSTPSKNLLITAAIIDNDINMREVGFDNLYFYWSPFIVVLPIGADTKVKIRSRAARKQKLLRLVSIITVAFYSRQLEKLLLLSDNKYL